MNPLGKTTLRTPRPGRALGYLALSALLGGAVAFRTLAACDGELVPPLDDTYIYLQYSVSAARGEPLAYQEGAEPTRGATSLLYPLLLAPAAAWLPRATLPWVALALGVLGLAATAFAADRWAARRAGRDAAWAAGLLVLCSGHFVWGALSGMDIACFALALTASAALVPWYEDAPHARAGVARLVALWFALAGLAAARPEGCLPALVVALALPLAARAPNSRRARWALVTAPFLVVGATMLVETLALGSPGPNTLEAKAVWSEQRPDVRHDTVMRLPWVYLQITRALFSDFRAPSYGHGTGVLLEVLLAGGAIAGTVVALSRRGDLAARVLVGMIVAGLLTGLVPVGWNTHHHRYQIPYVPLALLLSLYGLYRALPAAWGRRRLLGPAAVALLLLPGLFGYVNRLARNASNIHDHQVAMGRWIDEHLPETAVIGLNDAGAIAYYGGRPVVDLVGLVTNGSALPHRAGPGSLFEWLESLPSERRPTHFAIFPAWFPYLQRTSLVGARLKSLTLRENTISGADVLALYAADWSHTDRGERLWLRRELVEVWGFGIMDALDVADLSSERAHGYEAFPTWRSTLRDFPVDGAPETALIDGGRQPARGERFRMRARPGAAGALVMRTEAFRPFALSVRVDGKAAGTWTIPARPGVWTEPVLSLVDTLFTDDVATFELTLLDSLEAYPSFHYWLLQ